MAKVIISKARGTYGWKLVNARGTAVARGVKRYKTAALTLRAWDKARKSASSGIVHVEQPKPAFLKPKVKAKKKPVRKPPARKRSVVGKPATKTRRSR